MTRSRCTCSIHRDPDCGVDHEVQREREVDAVAAFSDPKTLLAELQSNRELLGFVADFIAWSTDFRSESMQRDELVRIACLADREIRRTVADRNKLARAA